MVRVWLHAGERKPVEVRVLRALIYHCRCSLIGLERRTFNPEDASSSLVIDTK